MQKSDSKKIIPRCKKDERVTVNSKFKRRIRMYLRENNLSVKQLALLCKVSSSTIDRILYPTQKKNFCIFTIDKICTFMGENYNSLFDEIKRR